MRRTFAEFKELAREIHGDRYVYIQPKNNISVVLVREKKT